MSTIQNFEAKWYEVVQLQDDEEGFCWGVRNKEYNTLEHKCYTLTQAAVACDHLSADLEDLINQLEPQKPKVLTLAGSEDVH